MFRLYSTAMHFSDKLWQIIYLQIFKTDNLPKQICQNCLDLLNGCIMFREMCQKTNQLMKRISSVPEIAPCIRKGIPIIYIAIYI